MYDDYNSGLQNNITSMNGLVLKLQAENEKLSEQNLKLLDALETLAARHRKVFGLDGAWDSELLQAERVIKEVRS